MKAAPTRPLPVTALAGLQFLAAAAGVIVLLGNGTIDGELTAGDVALAVVGALVGAGAIAATTGGGRYGWWAQLVLAPLVLLWGLLTLKGGGPGAVGAVAAGAWVGLLLVPSSRDWFTRPPP